MNNKLVSFFYILMRDHLSSGVIEEIIEKHVDHLNEESDIKYTNPYLEDNAKWVVKRLIDKKEGNQDVLVP